MAPIMFLACMCVGLALASPASSGEPVLSVSVVELTNAPSDINIPWLLPPSESFLPGVAIVDPRLFDDLERSGAGVRVLGEYIESDNLYLVQTTPFVSAQTLSQTGRVLWSSGGNHLISVPGDIRRTATLPNLRCRLLVPVEGRLSTIQARAWAPALPQQVPTPTEEQWIDQMVASVSQAEIEGSIMSLTGEVPVNLSTGEDTIRSRYSYHPDCLKASEYLYGRFQAMGIDVAYDSFFGIPLKAVAFRGLEGYVAGGDGIVYHTADGGKSWQKQAGEFGFSEETGEIVQALHACDPSILERQQKNAMEHEDPAGSRQPAEIPYVPPPLQPEDCRLSPVDKLMLDLEFHVWEGGEPAAIHGLNGRVPMDCPCQHGFVDSTLGVGDC